MNWLWVRNIRVEDTLLGARVGDVEKDKWHGTIQELEDDGAIKEWYNKRVKS